MESFYRKFRSYWLWVVAGGAILGTWLLVVLGRRKQDGVLRKQLQSNDAQLREQTENVDRSEAESMKTISEEAEKKKESSSTRLPTDKTGDELTRYLEETGSDTRK